MKENNKATKYLSKRNGAFTLIEVLISIALISVIATAYLSLMVSLDRRSTKLEIEDTAQSIAIDIVNDIRSNRLDVDGWSNIKSFITSTSERGYRYDLSTSSFVPDSQNNRYKTLNPVITSYSQMVTFCNSNPEFCEYNNNTVFRNNLSYSDIFSVAVTAKKVTSAVDSPRIITVHVGCKAERNCETYVKMSTVVYHY